MPTFGRIRKHSYIYTYAGTQQIHIATLTKSKEVERFMRFMEHVIACRQASRQGTHTQRRANALHAYVCVWARVLLSSWAEVAWVGSSFQVR